MRVLPLAVWHRGSDSDLVRDAALQSLVTHGHVRSQVCCSLYCLWVRATLQGVEDPWADATRRLRAIAAHHPGWLRELDQHVRPELEPHGRGSGYVVDCLHSARVAAQETDFAAVIRKAVAIGDDTDTTAAVAGGVAGVRYGLSGIPTQWRDALAGRELAEPLVARLLDHLRASPG
jgi:ADP-ribosylglycohydrolase